MTAIKHACKFCLSKTKVVIIAFLVEVVTFLPVHYIFERLGWM